MPHADARVMRREPICPAPCGQRRLAAFAIAARQENGMSDTVLYDVDGPIASVTLNRPERMNTMNVELLDDLLEVLERAADDDRVRVLILSGNGRAFCAGGDLEAMAEGTVPGIDGGPAVSAAITQLRTYMRSSQLLHEMPKVTIAAINGACAGAGLSLACACDIRLCSESAVFNTAFMTAGLSGDFGGTWTLPRVVGPARARELYLVAEKFRAADAERFGLVSRTLPDGELMGEVRRVAERIAGFAPLTMRAIKANLNDALRLSFAELLDREADRHIHCGLTVDAREAASAFLEKRTPRFVGR
jgi:2-(1,2-epoxy-1,2-dihydrophenyl)acetyl-CoA isomerase